jgi:hypothetical protein
MEDQSEYSTFRFGRPFSLVGYVFLAGLLLLMAAYALSGGYGGSPSVLGILFLAEWTICGVVSFYFGLRPPAFRSKSSQRVFLVLYWLIVFLNFAIVASQVVPALIPV